MQRPLLLSMVAFLLGILIAVQITSSVFLGKYAMNLSWLQMHNNAKTLLLIIGVVLAIVLICYRVSCKYKHLTVSNAFLLLFIFIVGLSYGLFKTMPISVNQYDDRAKLMMTGTIHSQWNTPNYYAIVIETNHKERLQVRFYHERLEQEPVQDGGQEQFQEGLEQIQSQQSLLREMYAPGDVIRVTGEYRKPAFKRNIGGFDERRYYWLQNWDGKLFANYNDIIKIGEDTSVSYRFKRSFHSSKIYYQDILKSSLYDREYAIVNALVLGDRGYIDYDTRDRIKNLGLSHLFAISGLHVGIIILVLIGFFDRICFTRDRTYWILLLLLPVYALLTGASPSVVRAVIMAELVIAGNLFMKKSDIYINMALAAFLLILFNPKYILHVGFQLTFIITLGIVLFEPIIDSYLKRVNQSWFGLRKLISVTMAAQIFAFPLLVFYFREFAWSVFVSQFLVLPIVSFLLLPAGVLMLLISWIHPALSMLPVFVLQKSAQMMMLITDSLEFATSYVSVFPEVHVVWLLLYFTLTCFIAYLLYYRRYLSKITAVAMISLMVLVGFLWLPKLPTGNLHITMIDVGQGDAIHIETPKGKHILIDGGGWQSYGDFQYDVGEAIVVPYLYARGIKRLDAVFLSHADHDHIDGLYSIFDKFHVKSFLFSVEDSREAFQRLMEMVKTNGSTVYQVVKGDRIEIDSSIVVEILHPDIQQANLGTPNNLSMVKLLHYNNMRILFTGDIEAEAEYLLLGAIDEAVDILKVAHHGSRTSSTELFIDKVKPKYSLIGVGMNNRFGHPNDEVVERLTRVGSGIYRTDEQGAIFIKIGKKNTSIKTMIQ